MSAEAIVPPPTSLVSIHPAVPSPSISIDPVAYFSTVVNSTEPVAVAPVPMTSKTPSAGAAAGPISDTCPVAGDGTPSTSMEPVEPTPSSIAPMYLEPKSALISIPIKRYAPNSTFWVSN